MKKLSINCIVIVVLSFLFVSCKETVKEVKEVSEETVQTEIKEVKEEVSEKMKAMLHGTSLPHYMNMILKNKEALGINEEQNKKLVAFNKDKSPQAVKMANRIKELEGEMYQQSLANTVKKTLVNQLEETLKLRTSLAALKIECRDEVLEILNEKQWNDLLEMYQSKMPFNNKTEMTALIKHVNPLPNYMQLVKTDVITLDKKQEENLSKWSSENHPKMMELAGKVNTLEKEVYLLSMQKESKANILKKVAEIADIKKQIVITKTDCRDNLISNILTEDQWEILAKK